MPKMSTDTE